jgi:hypothetical protein
MECGSLSECGGSTPLSRGGGAACRFLVPTPSARSRGEARSRSDLAKAVSSHRTPKGSRMG